MNWKLTGMAGIPKFVFEEQFQPGMSILTYGKTWCGKTWLTCDFISKMVGYNFKFGRCFYGSPASKKMFRRFVPEEFIMPPEKALLEEQLSKAQTRADDREEKGLEPEPNFIFADDCAFESDFMRCQAAGKLMSAGRNYGITRLFVLQKLTYALPEMRSGADIFCTAYVNEEPIRKDVYKTWFSMIGSFKKFERILDEATKDFGFLIINLRMAAQARDWRKCISWYRVEGDPTRKPALEILPHNLYVISKLLKTQRVKQAAKKTISKSGDDDIPVRLDAGGDVYELPNPPMYDTIVNAAMAASEVALPMPDWASAI